MTIGLTHATIYLVQFRRKAVEYTSCAFTGHRHVNPNHEKKLPGMLSRAVAYAYSKGCRKFLAGGAIGFDTLAACEVIRFKMSHSDVSLVLVLPCENQSERWSHSQKEMYNYVISNSDEVVFISERYTPCCMRERNKYLAENSDILISYVARSNSGSAQTVRMAKERGKEIHNIYPALEKIEMP